MWLEFSPDFSFQNKKHQKRSMYTLWVGEKKEEKETSQNKGNERNTHIFHLLLLFNSALHFISLHEVGNNT